MSVSELIPLQPSETLGRALCVITGASRGLGRTLAHQVACLLQPGSVLVLVARNRLLLQQLKHELEESRPAAQRLRVHCVAADLGTAEGLQETVGVAKQEACPHMDHLLVINNAASLGDVSRSAQSFSNLDEVTAYMSLNLSSVVGLTAGVLQAFPQRFGLKRTLVNISSACALAAKPSWVLYCTGKAARDMAFRVLAVEEPDIRVLSYSPGAMDTELQEEARRFTANEELREVICSLHREGQLLSCQQSGAQLLKLLLHDDFLSGSHIDYEDCVEMIPSND